MIETSSYPHRKSLEIFTNFWKNVQNVCLAFGQLLEDLWTSSHLFPVLTCENIKFITQSEIYNCPRAPMYYMYMYSL